LEQANETRRLADEIVLLLRENTLKRTPDNDIYGLHLFAAK
jgi:hypothetical protein